jgi:hypothetical protein
MSKLQNIIITALLVLLSSWINPTIVSAQNVHPAVDADKACMLGGVAGGKWLEAEKIAPMVKGGERYRVYKLTGPAGEAVGSKPKPGDPCTDCREVDFSPKITEGIAVAGNWNAMPRIPQALSTSDPAYRQVVARLLRKQGIVRPQINITRILRVDLEGDGVDEVLISATYLAGGLNRPDGQMAIRVKPGDYSFVVLRKIVGGKARDIVLAGEYYPKVSDATANQYEVVGVLDLNGDGKMEVVVSVDYYEGSSSTVFRINGTRVDNVFGCGWGA